MGKVSRVKCLVSHFRCGPCNCLDIAKDTSRSQWLIGWTDIMQMCQDWFKETIIFFWCSCLDVRRSLTLLRWDSLLNPTARTISWWTACGFSCWAHWDCWGASTSRSSRTLKHVTILYNSINIIEAIYIYTYHESWILWKSPPSNHRPIERSFCKVALDFNNGSSSTSWAPKLANGFLAISTYLYQNGVLGLITTLLLLLIVIHIGFTTS